jgi:nucleoside-diphosphate-sugar epimerase
MPTNLYGPGDNYHPDDSHVLAALMRRMHEGKRAGAPTVTVWGTGTPRREFLFVDDLADACVFALEHYTGESHLNVGSGEEVTSQMLASSSRKSSITRATSSSIRRVLTGRHANSATVLNSTQWDGAHERLCAMGSS